MTDHGLLSQSSALTPEHLPPDVHVVKMQFSLVNLMEHISHFLRRNALFIHESISFRSVKVSDHLEGRHETAIVELFGDIGKVKYECLFSLILEHEVAEAGTFVDFGLDGEEALVAAPSELCGLRTAAPLFNGSHASVR